MPAYAGNLSGTEAPNVAYAGVYPAAMIAKIVLAQLLLSRPFHSSERRPIIQAR